MKVKIDQLYYISICNFKEVQCEIFQVELVIRLELEPLRESLGSVNT